MGYGLVFISHEQMRTVKSETGEEYTKIMPTLPERPKLIVNRLVDIIAYLRLSPEDGKRYIYTRGNDKFEAGARFPYLKPKIEMSYDNLVEELYLAIEQQATQDNTELTDKNDNRFFQEQVSFESIMAEGKEVFQQLIAKDKEKYGAEMNQILLKHFGVPCKLSDATEGQKELVELVVSEWKTLL